MNVLILQDGLALRGADHCGASWARELVAAGHDVTILCLDGDGQGPARAKCGDGVRVVSGSGGPTSSAVVSPYDVVLVNSCPAALPLVNRLWAQGKRLILVLHGVGPWSQQFLAPEYRDLWNAVVVVAPHEVQQAIDAGVEPGKVWLVRPYPEPVAVVPRAEARAALHLSERAFVFGYAGRADVSKGVPYLVVALRHLVETGVDARLVLAGMTTGGRDERSQVEQQTISGVRQLAVELHVADRIRWIPASSDLSQFYGALDCACLVSTYEGSPLFVREALAAGIPVVATDVGDVREVATLETGSIVIPAPKQNADPRTTAILALRLMLVAARDEGTRDGYANQARERSLALGTGDRWRTAELPVLAHVIGEVGQKSHVLLVPDVPGWAFDRIAQCVKARFEEQGARASIVYGREAWDDEDAMRGATFDAHCAIFFHFGMYLRFREVWAIWKCPSVVCFFNLDSVEADDVALVATDGVVLAAGNKRYAARLSERFPLSQVVLIEDGVDTEMFSPGVLPTGGDEVLTVGWVGNSKHRDRSDGDLKGLETILRPAVALAQARGVRVQLLVADAAGQLRPHSEMPAFYRSIDLLACASRNEGTPNPVLEAAACGVPFLSTAVGLVPDFPPGCGVVSERSVDAFAEALCWYDQHRDVLRDNGKRARGAVLAFDWRHKLGQYEGAVRLAMAGKSEPQLDSRPDLSAEVTVFLVTVGSPVCADAVAALAKQDCRFRLDRIENVAPMDRAFQLMAERCTTPFFVQCDEDMILDSHAVRTLVQDLRAQPADVYMVCHPLYDEHCARVIQGVKAYRTESMRLAAYPVNTNSCEMSQVEVAKSLGYNYASQPLDREHCLGKHGTRFTDAEAFDRYYRLAQKQRAHEWLHWTTELPREFLRRIAACIGTPADTWGLLGYVSGLAAPLSAGERDYRVNAPSWGRLRSIMPEEPTSLNIYQTSECNQACRWCARTLGAVGYSAPDVTSEMLCRVLDRFPAIKAACVAGFGEPLLSSSLLPVLAELKRRGIWFQVITNGLLLEKHCAMLREHGCAQVSVSLNAATQAEHETETGLSGAFDVVMRGIRAAISAGLRVVVSRVVTQQTVASLSAFLDLAHDLGVAGVDLLNLLPHAVRSEEDEAAYWTRVLHDDMSDEVKAALTALRQHRRAPLVGAWPVPISRTCPGRCESPWAALSMDGWGHLGGCRRVDAPILSGASINDGDPWHSAPFVALRENVCGLRTDRRACHLCFGNWRG